VFTWPDGSPIHPQRFSAWFEQHAHAAGLPKIRLHDVRHSYASAALAAGIPAKVVSERLGHATIAATMDTYSHVLPGLDAEAAGTVARLILGDGEQEPARPVDKALTTDRPTPSRREEVKREAPGQRGVRAGGFEPPRVAPPGPKPGASAGSATLASCGGAYRLLGGALLNRPLVPAGGPRRRRRSSSGRPCVDPVGALVVLDLTDLDALLNQPGSGSARPRASAAPVRPTVPLLQLGAKFLLHGLQVVALLRCACSRAEGRLSAGQSPRAARTRSRSSSSGIAAASSGRSRMVPLLVLRSGWRAVKPTSRPSCQP
jgi:hypothetical protein